MNINKNEYIANIVLIEKIAKIINIEIIKLETNKSELLIPAAVLSI